MTRGIVKILGGVLALMAFAAYAQPVADLSITAVTFSERHGGVYGPKTPKPAITNQGPGNLVITDVYLSDESFFGSPKGTASLSGPLCTGAAPYTLAPGQSCDVDIIGWTFGLGTFGCYTNGAYIVSNASGGVGYTTNPFPLHRINVSLCAQAGPNARVITEKPDQSFTQQTEPPGALSFASATVGAFARPQRLLILSTGTTALQLSSITSSSPSVVFDADATNCGLGPTGVGSASIAASNFCEIRFAFRPSAVGPNTGTITIVSDAPTSPHVINFSGTGAAAALIGYSPLALNFADTEVGNDSGTSTLTITNNTGSAGSIAVSLAGANADNFAITFNDCASRSVAAGETCKVEVVFVPRGFQGARSANLVVTKGAETSSIPLTGAAITTAGALTVTPSIVNFGQVPIGSTSAVSNVTIQNTGVAGVVITGITFPSTSPAAWIYDSTANPAQRNCGLGGSGSTVVLAPSQSCVLALVCRPLDVGILNDPIEVQSSAPNGADYIGRGARSDISCEGVGSFTPNNNLGAGIEIPPPGLYPLTAKPVVTLRFSSTGPSESGLGFSLNLPAGLTVSTIPNQNQNTCGGTFTATNGSSTVSLSGATLPANPADCIVSFAVAAASAGSYDIAFTAGQISTAGGVSTSPFAATLRFATALPVLSVSDASYDFGAWPPNTNSFYKAITYTNVGAAPLSINGVGLLDGSTFSIDYSRSNCNGAVLQPNASCTTFVRYNGASAGTVGNTQLELNTAELGTFNVLLQGATPSVPFVTASPVPLNLGPVAVGASSSPTPIVLTNATGGALSITGPAVSGSFTLAGTAGCTALANSAGTCSPTVTYSPTAVGAESAAILVIASGVNYWFPVNGSGVTPGDLRANASAFAASVRVTDSTGVTLNLENVSGGPLTLSAPVLSGSPDWTLDYNFCTGSLNAAASCSIYYRFEPSATGARNASVSIAHSGAGSPVVVQLNGNGIEALDVTPSSVNFGSVVSGSSSSIVPVRFSASGCFYVDTVTITGANATDFEIIGNTCASNPNYYGGIDGFCDVGVRFNASGANSSRSAQLSLTGGYDGCPGIAPPNDGELKRSVRIIKRGAGGALNFKNGPTTTTVSVPLSASVGPSVTPSLGATPTALTFAAQTIAVASNAQTITVSNTGGGLITFASLTVGGPHAAEFTKSGTCSSTTTLAGGASCTIAVVFTPSAVGARNATVTIASSAPGSPHIFSLSGTGTAPGAPVIGGAAPPSGLVNSPYTFAFTATGTTPITWAVTAGSLPAGLTLSSAGAITGTPTAAGTFAFSVTATNTVGPTTLATAITVTQPIVPAIDVNPSSLNFGNQVVDSTSSPQVITVSNTGNGPFDITSITSVGDFAYTSNCPTTLQPNASCTLSVTFTPLIADVRNGRISVNNNASAGNSGINLTGTGVLAPRANMIATPSAQSFGQQALRSTSAPQIQFISNTGELPLQLRSLRLDNTAFALVDPPAAQNPNNLPRCTTSTTTTTVPARTSCAIGITFSPTVIGLNRGALQIEHNGSATGALTISTVTLEGTGAPASEALIRVSGGLNFTDTVVGRTGATQSVTVSNNGTINLNVGTPTIVSGNANTSSADFATVNRCTQPVQPNGSCTIDVTFTPVGATGAKSATLVVPSNASNAPTGANGAAGINAVSLFGTALAIPQPQVQLSATTIGFGSSSLGKPVGPREVRLTNIGNEELVIDRITLTNAPGSGDVPAFEMSSTASNACRAGRIGVGQSCVMQLTYRAAGVGSQAGVLTITSNAPSSPDRVQLSGSVCAVGGAVFSRFFIVSASCAP